MPTISSDILCCLMYCSVCEWSAEIDEVCEPRCPECGAKRQDMRILVESRLNLEKIKANLRKDLT